MNGEQVALAITALGSSVSFDKRNGDTLESADAVAPYVTANGQDLALIADPDPRPDFAGIEYQTFGVWLTGYNTGSGTVGAGSYGNKTSQAPEEARATYTGGTIGFAKGGTDSGIVGSNFALTTDFRIYTFATTNSTVIPLNGSSGYSMPDLDIDGSGTISNTSLSGTVSGIATLKYPF